MLFHDLSVTVGQRRWACVLDPALMLSRFGVPLIRRLGDVMDLWVVRELWHILDNSRVYLDRPELLFQLPGDRESVKPRERPDGGEIQAAMEEWERVRMESHLNGLKVYWLGDGFAESLVPNGTGSDLLWRFESLACSLDRCISGTPMACAGRDTAALAVALGGALILTCQAAKAHEADEFPGVCSLIANSVKCDRVRDIDPIANIERDHLRRLVVQAGAAGLIWAGLDLAVVHVVVPGAASLYPAAQQALSGDLIDITTPAPTAECNAALWEGARAFWYPL